MNSIRRARSWAGRYLDRRADLDTAGHLTREQLGYDQRERGDYQPSRWLALPLALPRRQVGASDVFADLGSGKGRVVLQAARRYRCSRVIGVEFSSELTAIAGANLARQQQRLRCPHVELVTADVLQWEVPADLTVAYLYNPFRGEIFSRAIERLADAVDRRGGPLRLIYVNAVEHERVMATGRAVELPPPPAPLLKLAGLSSGQLRRYELRPGLSEPSARGSGPPGSERKRSTMPSSRSVAIDTPGPIIPKASDWIRMPPIR